jgi:hypothetical protein
MSPRKLEQGTYAPERRCLASGDEIVLLTHSRSLLVSLAVLRALTIECRTDLHLFSESLMSAVDTTLSDVLGDLEVAARAASVVCKFVLDETTKLHFSPSSPLGLRIPTAILLAPTQALLETTWQSLIILRV